MRRLETSSICCFACIGTHRKTTRGQKCNHRRWRNSAISEGRAPRVPIHESRAINSALRISTLPETSPHYAESNRRDTLSPWIMDATITFTINGKSRTVTTDPQRPLLDVLREDLQLTGTKYGCGEGQCRACSVLMNGKSVASCTTPVSDAD